MSHLATLINDLALILICAGVMTLLFKKLKQPLVLGYVVAGFLASPHMPYTPSVMDTANIQTWADIGVIFLLFALGLEFSFKKIVKVGGAAIIAACTIIFCMILLGITVGTGFGWQRMDSIFLGGMIAMSSTTIIYKAFDDLGMRKKQFTGLVLSVLILEDILAIVLMVMLSTMAVRHNFEGSEMLESIGKLLFFLILWFVVGIYLIPELLKRCRKLMSEETLLIVSLGLCFGMVVMAARTGFSAAFGAFIMGSILAETVEAESIERLVKPVKDLFGAVFFVSVGMMVDPAMIVEYALPIIVITLAVIFGQSLFGTLGVLLAGQPLKTAMQCGFSLTQIGEFAFIIASLGVSLHVTSDFLYPIVVAVSVITTFLTPYMIRFAEPASNFVDTHLPVKWKNFLLHYSSGSQTMNHESLWKKLILALTRITIVYSIVSIAVVALAFRFLVPLFLEHIPGIWGRLLAAVVIILFISPFLRAIMIKKNHSAEFVTLWNDSRGNRAPLVATIVIRILIAVSFVMFVISGLFKVSVGLLLGVAVLLVIMMILSRQLKKQSIMIERKFFQNLRYRDMRAEYMGEKKPEYAGRLLSRDLHLTDFEVPGESAWAGKTLAELNFGKKYGIHVVSILRGRKRINIPGASVRLFPEDKIQVIGTDEELNRFSSEMEKAAILETDVVEKSEMILRQFRVDAHSIFLGKTMRESGIREQYHCLIVGVERGEETLHAPDPHEPFMEDDVVWIVGENADVYKLVGQKNENVDME
ncbi:cation:proton antiporter domain-containing protein [Bacteroides intestinalis]|jgi:CPA2 family monovalent cation:H+ antiporter-2|uniref:Sodium:proton antiporter n=2 Tax=Bacteroides intestinalis TaxID=329854 RepID=A0A4Q5HJV0_9BACE|nr:cation:proton antiporter [Bacteroides intestinalis]KAA4694722.1 sodium:proton antiporter [Bacteroides intestinalis]RHE85008.1 sodium:proton antiporter [Bacteroides intestinalis]RYT82437.1 sodium:proton antiporter [Bacteroides intestinalis]